MVIVTRDQEFKVHTSYMYNIYNVSKETFRSKYQR